MHRVPRDGRSHRSRCSGLPLKRAAVREHLMVEQQAAHANTGKREHGSSVVGRRADRTVFFLPGGTMFKHILLPTDGSHLSDKGVKQAIRMAKSIGASITAVHIVRSYHA